MAINLSDLKKQNLRVNNAYKRGSIKIELLKEFS